MENSTYSQFFGKFLLISTDPKSVRNPIYEKKSLNRDMRKQELFKIT